MVSSRKTEGRRNNPMGQLGKKKMPFHVGNRIKTASLAKGRKW